MHRRNRRLIRPLAAALVAFPFAVSPALAGEGDRDGTAEELARVRAALEEKGYTDVHDLELDDGRFEVDARNPAGESVDLELEVDTLQIVEEDLD
jgi:hypothetical protein